VVFGGAPMAVYRIMSVRMQAFAEGTCRLLPTTYRESKNNAIPNEKRINPLPTFNAFSTPHWPVFSDKAFSIAGGSSHHRRLLAHVECFQRAADPPTGHKAAHYGVTRAPLDQTAQAEAPHYRRTGGAREIDRDLPSSTCRLSTKPFSHAGCKLSGIDLSRSSAVEAA
jgi:hypothetical protein